MRNIAGFLCLTVAASVVTGLAAVPVRAGSASIEPVRDTTVQSSEEGRCNGSGDFLFTGRTGQSQDFLRRALLVFDVASVVPAGATITDARLTLSMNKTRPGTQNASLSRLLADWGEGASNAPGNEGGMAAAAPGDATWDVRFFPGSPWAVSGGDFAALPSATIAVGGVNDYTWGSTPALVADVQAWADDPSSNFGWILIGNETATRTAKRFVARENASVNSRPRLEIEFDPPPAVAGRVPDGNEVPGTPLTVQKLGGGTIRLEWDDSCRASDTDYGVYEGEFGDPASQLVRTCSTGGAALHDLVPGAGDRFYVVVPHNGAVEGAYGTDSAGAARAAAGAPCFAQAIDDPVCP
ncbi:MAG: DNRLRE domain-containing protein [bacterium]|nr:DNRLRE domain-containing protein [bacterium]